MAGNVAQRLCSLWPRDMYGAHLTTVSPTSSGLVLLPTWPPPANQYCR